MYLTKSDFKACVDCPTRLHYRKAKFPSAKDDNEYLQFLADGGFMIEFLAKARFANSVDLVALRDPVAAFDRTKAALAEKENVAVFEAAANDGVYHVRTDVLVKEGKTLRLIEVKSSSIDTRGDEETDSDDEENDATAAFFTKRGPRRVTSRWLPYLQDLTFQTLVLEAAFPQYTVQPFLAVVDKGQIATDAETLGQFTLTTVHTGPADKRPRPEVVYAGTPAQLATSKLIVVLDAKEAVDSLRASVKEAAAEMAKLLTPAGATRKEPTLAELYRTCRDCEFRVEVEGKPSGFGQCWAGFPATNSHILDLHRVGQIGSGPKDPVPTLLAGRTASYLDLRPDQLGNPGAWATRRTQQWEGTKNGKVWQAPKLRETLEEHSRNPGYPLHFIDFEACNISLPHHAGLHPYERVAFQWSCHTVTEDGAVSHQGWLNDQRAFPNFDFARTLRSCIGDKGTVYVWSNYEQVTLRKVLDQLLAAEARGLGQHDAALARWLESILGPADEDGKRRNSPRIRDLHDLAYAHYFHPAMKGRTSIKVVLPAVWQSDEKLRNHPLFRHYLKTENGTSLDPYKALPALPLGQDSVAVREGTGAIRVYQDLIFNQDVANRENRRELLWQYCQLDTAAMLMIWMHWLGRYELTTASP